MKALSFSIAFLITATVASAQKVYFAYLQTDGSIPFYVKMGGRTYSSNAGYVILPNLRDSSYSLAVGVPDKGETRFNVAINGRDRGFLVKNFDNIFNLFDMQSLAVTKPVVEADANTAYQTKTDPFTQMLSKAANDTSLLKVAVKNEPAVESKKEKPIIRNSNTAEQKETEAAGNNGSEVIKTGTGEWVTDTGSVTNSTTTTSVADGTEKPALPVSETPKERAASRIIRHSGSATAEGFNVVYFDNSNGISDTIRLIIPNPKNLAPIADQVITKEEPVVQQSTSVQVNASNREEAVIPAATAPVREAPVATAEKKVNNCPAIATDDDFFRIRKNMVSKNGEEGMVTEAKKYFKNKCFRTEQIKYLSALLLTAEGKYNFFDAAYSHVTDKENFAALSTELKDDYYLNRFKAMLQ